MYWIYSKCYIVFTISLSNCCYLICSDARRSPSSPRRRSQAAMWYSSPDYRWQSPFGHLVQRRTRIPYLQVNYVMQFVLFSIYHNYLLFANTIIMKQFTKVISIREVNCFVLSAINHRIACNERILYYIILYVAPPTHSI